MNIGIIGAGKVGCTLARAMKFAGMSISGVYSRSAESAALLAKEVDGIFPNDLKTTVEQAGVVFITVNDDAIEDIVKKIANKFKRRSGFPLHGKAFFHCSGAKSSDVLGPLRDLGADVGSLHPLMTFPDKNMPPEELEGISFCMEGDPRCLNLAMEITDRIETNIFFLNSPEDKPLYHVGACIVSNYMNVLVDLACAVFHEIGIPAKDAMTHCLPLIYASLENTLTLGPSQALTGPIVRGDVNTVKTHIQAINARMPWLSDGYRILGLYAAAAANADKKISNSKYMKLVELLEEGDFTARPLAGEGDSDE